jgi:hypothetical protein
MRYHDSCGGPQSNVVGKQNLYIRENGLEKCEGHVSNPVLAVVTG